MMVKKIVFGLLALCCCACLALADVSARQQKPAAATAAALDSSSSVELARATLKAHGGEKFCNLKNTVLVGTADLFGPNSTRAVPAQFVSVTEGVRARLELNSPGFKLSYVDNGERHVTSIRGMELPPGKLGLNMLQKFDQPGYTVTALPAQKKSPGFRITDASGDATDFYVNTATGRVSLIVTTFDGNSNSVEFKSFKEIDGVVVPFNYVQKLSTPQGAYFAEYKVKEAKFNQKIGDDVFAIAAK